MQRILLITFKAAVSVGLLYFALTRIDLGAAVDRIDRLNIAWILFGFCTIALQVLCGSIRWTVIADQCGTKLILTESLRLNLVGSFFNQVLPSTVGGDAMRMWLFAREGAGWPKATRSVFIDRFIALLALAVLVTICLPWSFQLIGDPTGRLVLLLFGCGCTASGVAFIVLGNQSWSWISRFWVTRQLTELAIGTRRSFSSADRFIKTMGSSFVSQILGASLGWSVAKAIGIPFELPHALVLMPPVALITIIPISIAGWGVRESAFMLGFGYAGLSPSDGFLVSILIGANYFVLGLIGGIAWLLDRRNVPISTIRLPMTGSK